MSSPVPQNKPLAQGFKNMKTSRFTLKCAALFATIVALAACVPPPVFYSTVAVFAVQGNDVGISVNVSNSPTSVTCFNGAVTLTRGSGDTHSGTVPTAQISTAGSHPVVCNATNANGSITATVGAIVVIPNTPPTVVGLTTAEATSPGGAVVVLDRNGNQSINEPLIDTAATSNVTGAVYVLDASSDALPGSLGIDTTNGNLVGTVNVTGQSFQTNIVVRATTVAGTDTTQGITLYIYDNPGDSSNPDGDSVGDNTDCDESDSNNFPGNTEVADGKDNDCDGAVDEP